MNKQNVETHVVKPNVVLKTNDGTVRLLSSENETALDKLITDIDTYMSSNDGFGKEDTVKDELYNTAISLWKEYASVIKSCKFSLHLNRKQYQFLTDLLIKKLEYDVDTLFVGIELTNMLGIWRELGSSHSSDTDINSYEADATEITYIYHLIAKYKIKGLTSDSYRFAEVLRKIGDISKVIKYYDTNAQNMSAEIQKWAAKFEPEEVEEVTQIEEA